MKTRPHLRQQALLGFSSAIVTAAFFLTAAPAEGAGRPPWPKSRPGQAAVFGGADFRMILNSGGLPQRYPCGMDTFSAFVLMMDTGIFIFYSVSTIRRFEFRTHPASCPPGVRQLNMRHI